MNSIKVTDIQFKIEIAKGQNEKDLDLINSTKWIEYATKEENDYPIGNYDILSYHWPDKMITNNEFSFHNQLKKLSLDIDTVYKVLSEVTKILRSTFIPESSDNCPHSEYIQKKSNYLTKYLS